MPLIQERLVPVVQLREWANRGRLFAILDATDTPSVPRKANELGPDRAVSLYRGRAEEELWAIAPFLVHLDVDTLEWITDTLWPEPWGIFALADESLDAIRLHFRRFLTVEGPNGESWYFRFYDPRVLPRYLASCTAEELATFLGPVRAFGVTDPISYGVKVLRSSESSPSITQPRAVIRR